MKLAGVRRGLSRARFGSEVREPPLNDLLPQPEASEGRSNLAKCARRLEYKRLPYVMGTSESYLLEPKYTLPMHFTPSFHRGRGSREGGAISARFMTLIAVRGRGGSTSRKKN